MFDVSFSCAGARRSTHTCKSLGSLAHIYFLKLLEAGVDTKVVRKLADKMYVSKRESTQRQRRFNLAFTDALTKYDAGSLNANAMAFQNIIRFSGVTYAQLTLALPLQQAL